MNADFLSPNASMAFMAVLTAALLVHLSRLAGPHRLDHLVYALTAAGLLYLFGTSALGWAFAPRWVLFGIFAALSVAIVATVVWRKARNGDAGFFWETMLMQQAAMAYIFAPFLYWKPPISAFLLLYFLLELFNWLKGAEQTAAGTQNRYPPLIAPKRMRGPREFALAGAAAAFSYVFAMGTSKAPVALPPEQAAPEQATRSDSPPEEPAPTDEPSPEARDKATAQSPKESPPAAMPAAKESVYTAAPGDTLKSIAKKLYGRPEKWRAIAEANPGLKRGSKLKAGQVIKLPEPTNRDAKGAK